MQIPKVTTLKISTCLVFFKSKKYQKGIEDKAANTLPIDIAPENIVREIFKSSDIGTTNIEKFKLPAAVLAICTNPIPINTYHPKYILDFSLILFEIDFKNIYSL